MIYFVLGLLVQCAVGRCEIQDLKEKAVADDAEFLSQAKALLARLNVEYGEWLHRQTISEWANFNNTNDEIVETIEQQILQEVKESFRKDGNNLSIQLPVSFSSQSNFIQRISQDLNQFPWQNLKDFDTRRQFQKLHTAATNILSRKRYKKLNAIINKMQMTYSTAKICDYKNPIKCDLTLVPDITDIFSNSSDTKELKSLWIGWRNATGRIVKNDFIKYVELSNKVAKNNSKSDMEALWLDEYETPDFAKQIDTLWTELKPLYLQLHAYVRRQLRIRYGENIVVKDGPIPAHLFGDLWAHDWSQLAKFSTPYPGKYSPDVSNAMIKQGYNVTTMFRLAEEFFVSLNLSKMPEGFWEKSILEKDKGVDMVCQASAWDFYDGEDFRIKACTRINMIDLEIAHHEMGHIQYYLQYKNLPAVYKTGANPGFHEAVGDTISLSAMTPAHFRNLGLLNEVSTDYETIINHLYSVSLYKIAILSFAYAIVKWRTGVFQGVITPDTYNCNWWSIVENFRGIEPPVDRSENDFDPGAKFHIIADVEYARYFVSFVIQFQFHKALCTEAGQYDPLNPESKPLSECNIYGSKKAGYLLKSMLELGSSKPWPDAMEKLTGQRKIDTSGILEYFKPLMDWLRLENRKTNEYIGWKPSKRICRSKDEINEIEV